jgi:hypothetical protein
MRNNARVCERHLGKVLRGMCGKLRSTGQDA